MKILISSLLTLLMCSAIPEPGMAEQAQNTGNTFSANTIQVRTQRSLTLAGAQKVLGAAIQAAKEKKAPGGSIAVVDEGGNLITLVRLDSTFAASANVATGKARTAALFQRPTRVFEDSINKGRTALVGMSDFTPLQGGIPIVVDDQVVGAIGVSGAASAQQDEEIAIAGSKALK